MRQPGNGTVGLTAVGMFGNRGGWGLDAPIHTLEMVVDGIAQKLCDLVEEAYGHDESGVGEPGAILSGVGRGSREEERGS